MSTHSIDVIRINEVLPHPNADKLEVVMIDEFSCCVRKGDFKAGDLAVYIEPDYIVNTTRPEFEFLGGKGNVRIKVKRLRGVISQGLLIPAPDGFKEGDNVIDHFGIVRYEPEIKLVKTRTNSIEAPKGYYPVYDLENWRKYSRLFVDGEQVQITEKIHGCLSYNTLILMADGTQEKIGRLVNNKCVNKQVMAMDENGNITTAKITNVFNNGSSQEWLKIKGTRKGIGRGGNNYFSIWCTPNHKIWSNGKYVYASELKKGDIVSSFRSEYKLTPVQEQVILGKILGDGSLIKNESSGYLSFSHKKNHEEYIDWTLKFLGDLACDTKYYLTSGYGTEMIRSHSVSSIFVREFLNDFYENDKKIVPKSLIEKINPIGLAFWYMDDGSLGHEQNQEDRANFACCNFTKKDCEILQECLQKFNINSILYGDEKRYRLRLNSDEADKFFLLIAPYVPEIMQYKLPEYYRGFKAFCPNQVDRQYKPAVVDQIILSVEKESGSYTKYDIETETHNFFASGILVHNSNARYKWSDGKMYCGSHRQWVGNESQNPWHMALEQNPWISAFCENHPDLTVYGEVFGWVQNLRYGAKEGQMFFRAFDLLRGNKWLNWDEVVDYARDESMFDIGEHLHWVPLLIVGSYSKELIQELVDGPSKVPGANHIREGIVVKPVIERNDVRFGRVALKVVSNDYLEKNFDIYNDDTNPNEE